MANRTDSATNLQARFRVTGREAELWHPDTGMTEPSDYSIEGDRTVVPLELDPRESVFVVFRLPAQTPTLVRPPVEKTLLTTVEGPWEVHFPPDLGAPEQLRLEKLESWTQSSDEGVKYFSGTAVYTKALQVPEGWLDPENRIVLDLGAVGDIARISINGEAAGILWKPPYRADITGLLKAGRNLLEIGVTNQWTNRQVGDSKVEAGKKVLSPMPGWMGRFGAPQALSTSGLLGPVTVSSLRRSD